MPGGVEGAGPHGSPLSRWVQCPVAILMVSAPARRELVRKPQAAGLTELQARGDIGISAVVDLRKQHVELPTGLGQRCLALNDIQRQHRLAPR